mmetsp:Transcript_48686/g.117756  ORF Transcript_48686/g.117756 Transcript_48686/m.117756 type:complete len:863 (-) Transcript_48686:95-2683(-)
MLPSTSSAPSSDTSSTTEEVESGSSATTANSTSNNNTANTANTTNNIDAIIDNNIDASISSTTGVGVVTRHRKSLLKTYSDLEDGHQQQKQRQRQLQKKHVVPSPSLQPQQQRRSQQQLQQRDYTASTGALTSSIRTTRISSWTNRLSSSYLNNEDGGDGGNGGGGDPSNPERWAESIKKSCGGCQQQDGGIVGALFPIWKWLKVYPWKQYGITDIIAGLTVGVMIIPQSMSYAKLAGLPVQYGLYSSLVPIYAYAVWGSSRQLAVGPVALVSLLVNAGLTIVMEREGKTPDNTPDYDEQYAIMALQTSVLVGLCYIGMGLLKLGFIANFLSHAVVSGFTSAAAIIIGISQLKYFFGYDVPNDKALHKMLYNLFSNIDQFNWKTFLLGSCCLGILVGLKRLVQAFPKRMKWAKAAGPLLVTVLSIVLQATIDLQARGVPIVNYIPKGLPSFSGDVVFPVNFGNLSVVVISVVIVGFMESVAIAKKLAQKHGYELDASMEMVGLGMANLSSGLFGGYPVTGSFSRSAVNNESGAHSGISAIVTATMVALTLLFLTSIFELLPLATLAAIVISGVISLVDYPEAIYLWKVHRFDFGVWLVAFFLTLFLGVELGLGIAVGISLLLVLFESAYPPTSELGRLPGTAQYRNIKQYPEAETYDGIIVVRIDAPIYFANVQHVRDKVQKYFNRAAKNLSSAEQMNNDDNDIRDPSSEEVQRVQFVILELSPVAHIDTTGLHAIQEMASTFKKNDDVQLCLANPNRRVMHRLVSSGLANEIGRDHIYVSTHDAIDDCLHHMDRRELKRVYESAQALDKLAVSNGSAEDGARNDDNESHDHQAQAATTITTSALPPGISDLNDNNNDNVEF